MKQVFNTVFMSVTERYKPKAGVPRCSVFCPLKTATVGDRVGTVSTQSHTWVESQRMSPSGTEHPHVWFIPLSILSVTDTSSIDWGW